MRAPYIQLPVFLGISLALLACTSSTPPVSPYTVEELQQRNETLLAREAEVSQRESELAAMQSQSKQQAQTQPDPMTDSLLPPNADPGECYARVWVEPTYKQRSERVLVKEPSTRTQITPAVYETVTERVLVSEGSSRLEVIPATYETLTERRKISEAERRWLVSLTPGAVPANADALEAAREAGVDLEAATPNMCYHEHFIPAKFADFVERRLVKDAYDVVNTQEAKFRWVEKRIMVSEASTRLEVVPAQYETVSEQVVDVPAHQVWKKGTGPIQRIDAATGEIMCLVDVPATYKTLTRKELISPETTREIEVPARYETVKVKERISDASESRRTMPAEYKEVPLRRQVADAELVWHEVHDNSLSSQSRTGRQICLVEEPAKYETVTRTVVKVPASTRKIESPAEYKTVEVERLVKAAEKRVIEVPGEYQTVNLREVDRAGFMEWRSILCETNMDLATIKEIQKSLSDRGFNPGSIDGVIGAQTLQAVKAFQSKNDLPQDEYLNMDTIRALGLKL